MALSPRPILSCFLLLLFIFTHDKTQRKGEMGYIFLVGHSPMTFLS